jgi:hypothetical protein
MNEAEELLIQEKTVLNNRRKRINLLIAIILFTIFLVIAIWVIRLPTFSTYEWIQWNDPLQCRRSLGAYIGIGTFLSCAVIERFVRINRSIINPLFTLFIFGAFISGLLLVCE